MKLAALRIVFLTLDGIAPNSCPDRWECQIFTDGERRPSAVAFGKTLAEALFHASRQAVVSVSLDPNNLQTAHP